MQRVLGMAFRFCRTAVYANGAVVLLLAWYRAGYAIYTAFGGVRV
jgi:hypothetical protein